MEPARRASDEPMRAAVLAALVLITGCATPPPVRMPADAGALHFAGVDEVPVGRWAWSRGGERIDFVLAREGDGFRFESFDARGVRRDTAHVTLTDDGRWLHLPGHHGLRFEDVDGKVFLDVIYCYVAYSAAPAT
jgi:hypothetical protein